MAALFGNGLDYHYESVLFVFNVQFVTESYPTMQGDLSC